jgi:hypothetical protein
MVDAHVSVAEAPHEPLAENAVTTTQGSGNPAHVGTSSEAKALVDVTDVSLPIVF